MKLYNFVFGRLSTDVVFGKPTTKEVIARAFTNKISMAYLGNI